MARTRGVDGLDTPLNTKQATKTATNSPGYGACADDPGLQRQVAAFVAALPHEQRATIMLRVTYNLSYAEIAANLHCSEHDARTTAYEVLRSLRTHVADRL